MATRFSIEAIFEAVDKVTGPVRKMQTRVSKFTRGMLVGLKRVNRVVNKIGGAMKRGALATLKGVTIAVGLLALAVRGLTKEADLLAKTSRLLDFDIERLQEYRFAAGIAGQSTEQFDKALEQFTKRVGEARAGTGSMVTLLRKSNPELLKQILLAKDNATAFKLLIKGIENTAGAQDKLALANAAGGRSAKGLVLLAGLGSKEFERLALVQRENGNITKEMTDASEAFNDQMLTTMNALKGFRNQVIAPLLPLLTQAANAVRDWTIANRDSISEDVLAFARDVGKNFQNIIKWGKRLFTVAKWVFGLVIALKALTAVLVIVNLLMTMNPVGLIIVGVIALIAALTTLVIFWDDVVDMFRSAPLWLKILGGAIAFIVGGPIGALVASALFIMDQWGKIKTFFNALFIGVRKEFDEFMIFVGLISDTFARLWEKLPGPLKTAFQFVIDVIRFQLDILLALAEGLISKLSKGVSVLGATFAAPEFPTSSREDQPRLRENPQTVSGGGDSVSRSELTIRDESGKAEVTKEPTDRKAGNVTLIQTGSF